MMNFFLVFSKDHGQLKIVGFETLSSSSPPIILISSTSAANVAILLPAVLFLTTWPQIVFQLDCLTSKFSFSRKCCGALLQDPVNCKFLLSYFTFSVYIWCNLTLVTQFVLFSLNLFISNGWRFFISDKLGWSLCFIECYFSMIWSHGVSTSSEASKWSFMVFRLLSSATWVTDS